jgi:hypothetical protein
MITTALTTSTQGLLTQGRRVQETAQSIVTRGADGDAAAAEPLRAERGSADGAALGVQLQAQEDRGDAGLTGDIVRLIEAEVAYKANAEAVRAAEALSKETLNLVS